MNQFEQHQPCLLCGNKDFVSLAKEYEHAYLVKCKSCGLVFGKRIPAAAELQAHYKKYKRAGAISPITIRRYEELLEKFEPYRENNRILDIGCGDGYFLETAKRKGWEVYGTEFTDEAVAVCRAKGVTIHQGILQDFQTDKTFDVITSFEVIEHINDGREHAAKIFGLLRSGGLFYVTTPNFNSISRRRLGGKWNIIEYPEHLTYYTARTLTKLLERAGFQKLSMKTTGFSVQRFRKSTGQQYAEGTDENLRASMEEKFHLRLAKKIINGILSLTHSGDTLKGFYRKP